MFRRLKHIIYVNLRREDVKMFILMQKKGTNHFLSLWQTLLVSKKSNSKIKLVILTKNGRLIRFTLKIFLSFWHLSSFLLRSTSLEDSPVWVFGCDVVSLTVAVFSSADCLVSFVSDSALLFFTCSKKQIQTRLKLDL